jgi:hypothetical protein
MTCRSCHQPFTAEQAAAAGPASHHEIECPDCGTTIAAGSDFCFSCGHDGTTGGNLFASDGIAVPAPPSIPPASERELSKTPWSTSVGAPYDDSDYDNRVLVEGLIGTACGAALVGMCWMVQPNLSGPWFLGLYGLMLAICWTAAEYFRGRFLPLIGIPAITFVTIGLLRYQQGVQAGMQKFMLLFVMMIGGTIAILAGLRSNESKASERHQWWFCAPGGLSVAMTGLVLFAISIAAPPVALIGVGAAVMYGSRIGDMLGHGSSGGGTWDNSSCSSSCGSSSCGGGGGGCGGCGS